MAVWLGGPPSAEAQARKSGPDPKAAAGEAKEPKSPPRATLLRVQVVKPEPGPADPGARRFARPPRFGFQDEPRAGTTLRLLLEDPDRSLEGVAIRESRITKFGDDKGTDLLAEDAEPQAGDVRGFPAPRPSGGPIAAEAEPEGHRVTVTLHSPRVPASGATRILLEANLVLKYSRGERVIEQKDVDLKLDKIMAGPIPLIIAAQSDDEEMMGFQGQGQNGTPVILFHQGPQSGIKNLAFIRPDGSEIKATASGSGSSGSLHQTYYQLAEKVETCTLRITVPEVTETATLAVSVTTGVGFPPGVRRAFVPSAGSDAEAPKR